MDIYTGLEYIFRKKQILEYEKKIKEIDENYYIYRVNNAVNFTLDTKVDYCLRTGLLGFKYYVKEYIESEFLNEQFKLLIDETESLINEEKKLEEKITQETNVLEKHLDCILKKLNLTKPNTVKEKIDIIYNKYKTDPKSFGSYEKAMLFCVSLSNVDAFSDIYNQIAPLLTEKIKKGENVIIATKEILSEKQIDLDLNHFFNYYSYNEEKEKLEQKKQKIREEITKKLPEVIIANGFMCASLRLKNQISTLVSRGLTEEEALNKVLPEAYGLVKAACEYILGQTAYDVQLMGAIAMNEGKVCEMYTGEGKTLTAIFPAYLNALLGKEVNIFTPNDYLSERDSNKNRKVFELLGMKVGCVKSEEQSIEEKKKAYSCDIIYGSTSAFAFDYLKDTNRTTSDKLVQRSEKPHFVIIDEADQILINNAMTPFVLEESARTLSLAEKKENKEVIRYLKEAFEIEKILSSSVYEAESQKEFDEISIDLKEPLGKQNLYNLIVLGNKRVVITTKGEKELFSHVMKDKIEELTLKNRDYFLSSDEFLKNTDYIVTNEKVVLTLSGIDKAIERMKEFYDLNMSWLTEEKYQVLRKYINNALVARYLLEKGKDYQVAINPNTNREEVIIEQDNRFLLNNKYKDALHHAIELKEGLGVIVDKGERLFDDFSSTISNRALISRYSKISGMTGTADKSMFSEVYGLETFEVPRNKEYEYSKRPKGTPPIRRIDNPTVLCKTQNDKLNRIIVDIITSHSKGQPILVVTNNDEEAKALSEILNNLPEPYNNIKSNLLIAGKTLEEEAEIISEAGKLGSITVASEMAGRGTDIKLGGEVETSIEVNKAEIIELEAIDLKMEKVLKIVGFEGELSLEKKEKIRNLIRSRFNYDNSFLEQEFLEVNEKCNKDSYYRDKIDYLTNEKIEEKKKKVYETGGLKYIQMTPFKTTRNDNQGKGRVGRQGEPGETVMYCSLEDLKTIGADDEKVHDKLKQLLGDKKYIDDIEADGFISEVIETAQSEEEFYIDYAIAMNDTNDLAMSSIGQMLLRTRKQILSQDSIEYTFECIIGSAIHSIIKDNVPTRKRKKIDKDKTKLSKLKLNIEGLISSVDSIFGIVLDADDIVNNCTNIIELKWFIYEKAIERKKDLEAGLSVEKINSAEKTIIINALNETYIDFIEEAKMIELQIMNDRIANNPSHNRVLEFQNLYNECVKAGWYSCMSNIFKPGLKKNIEESSKSSEVELLINDLRGQDGYNDLYVKEETSRKK